MTGQRLVVGRGRFHTYSLDGRRVPSVSAVKGVLDKPALVGAAAREVAAYASTHADELSRLGEGAWRRQVAGSYRELWNESMTTGKQLHSIAERLIAGEPVETYDTATGEPYPDDVVRMGEQVARFLDAWDVTPDTALVERPVFHETELYAGTFDLQAVLRGGDRWMIDYKTGASGVWPETSLQVTAYARATHVQLERDGRIIEMRNHPTDRCGALWVRPDGWELVPVKSDAATWEVFRYALRILPWTRLDRDDVIGAALPVPEVA